MPVFLYPPLAVLLFATNAILPQIGIIAGIFSPMVLLLYLSHKDRNRFYDMFAGALIAGLFAFNQVLAGFFLISPLFTAVFMRYCNRNNIQRQWLPAVGSAMLSLAVTFFIIYALPSYRESLVEFTTNTLSMFMKAAKDANAPMVGSPYYAQIGNNPTQAATALVMIFPSFNFIYTAAAAFISLNLFSKMKRVELPKFRLPDNLVWLLIAGFGLIFVQNMTLRFIGINLAFILMTLYTFQGFEVVSHWLKKWKVLPVLKAIIFVFIFSEPPIILGIALLGLFSIWFNFFGSNDDDKEQEKSE